jgi:NAD(P)-dependent dehydrogenase (short-subunit alcohol dehydrogenase family)
MGWATSLPFAAAGAAVVADTDGDGAAGTVAEITSSGGRSVSVATDVSDADAVAGDGAHGGLRRSADSATG